MDEGDKWRQRIAKQGSGRSAVQTCVSCASIEMQIPLSQLIMGAVRSVCVHAGEILTHLLTCLSNGVQMGSIVRPCRPGWNDLTRSMTAWSSHAYGNTSSHWCLHTHVEYLMPIHGASSNRKREVEGIIKDTEGLMFADVFCSNPFVLV